MKLMSIGDYSFFLLNPPFLKERTKENSPKHKKNRKKRQFGLKI
jgi:hypothetical protein